MESLPLTVGLRWQKQEAEGHVESDIGNTGGLLSVDVSRKPAYCPRAGMTAHLPEAGLSHLVASVENTILVRLLRRSSAGLKWTSATCYSYVGSGA